MENRATTMQTPPRQGLWVGAQAALFDHRCPQGAPPGTEFFVSAPCVVMVRRGGLRTRSALGVHVADAVTLIFRNAMEGYEIDELPGVPHEATTLRIAPGLMRAILADINPRAAEASAPVFATGSAPACGIGVLLHAAVRRTLDSIETVDDLEMEEAVLRLVGLGVRRAFGAVAPRGKVTAKGREAVREAQRVLLRRAVGKVRLGDVAQAVGCSEWHLARTFRAVTGSTIHAYITRHRLAMSLDAVLGGTQGLTRAAITCGFADHSHFTAAFGREFGMTPSEARGMRLSQLLQHRVRPQPGRGWV